jgi:hypothetical protein
LRYRSIVAVVASGALVAGCSGGGSSTAGPATTAVPSAATAPAANTSALAQLLAFRHFFATDPGWTARELGGLMHGGTSYCGVDALGASPDGGRRYLWVFCQEYYRHGATVAEGTGVDVPVLAAVTMAGDGTPVVRD